MMPISKISLLLLLLICLYSLEGKSSGLLDNFYFDPAPVDQEVIERSEVRLRCDVSNRRNITFNWLFNGKQITNTSRRYEDGSDMMILRIDRYLDSGIYTCIATNLSSGFALRSTGAKLTVQWIEDKPEVQILKPERQEILEDDEAVLKCSIGGESEPMVDWYKNYARLFTSERVRFLKHRLRISAISPIDEGVYTCRGRNVASESDHSNALVITLPDQTGSGQLITDQFSSQIIAKEGFDVELSCPFMGMETFWYFGDKTSIKDGLKYMISDNGTINIINFTLKDEGIYLCSSLQSLSLRSNSKNFAIRVQMAYLKELTSNLFEPRPLDLSINYVIPNHGRGEITCLAPDGNPPPTLRWENPYGQEIGNRSSQSRSANKTLVLTNLQEGHSGNYTCIAENLAGSCRYSVWVAAAVLPKVSLPPLSTRATEGSMAQFECKYVGSNFPITTIRWNKDDQYIDPKDGKYLQNGTVLRVNDVSGTDEGNYACTLDTIGYPRVYSASARLYVEKLLKFRPIPIDTKIELHSISSIPCRAEGKLTPKINWFKGQMTSQHGSDADESKMKVQNWISDFPDHVSQGSDGSLNFERALREDGGVYMCRAANEEQGHINATIHVQVVVRPKFKVTPKNTSAAIGSWVMMNCFAVGEPTPYVQWDKDGQVIDTDQLEINQFIDLEDGRNLMVHPNGSLTINNVQTIDAGKYGCTAGNNGGLERHEAFLNVVDTKTELYHHHHHQSDAKSSWNSTKTALVAIFSALAYMVVVIVPTVVCILKARRKLKNASTQESPTSDELIDLCPNKNDVINQSLNSTPDKKDGKKNKRQNGKGKRGTLDTVANHIPATLSTRADDFSTIGRGNQFTRKQLNFIGMLGKGKYGDVYLAKLLPPTSKDPEGLNVIVKSHSSPGTDDIDHDIDTFSDIDHINVAKILHVCRKDNPILVVSEHCEWGDLKHFLIAMKPDSNDHNNISKDQSTSSTSNLSEIKEAQIQKNIYANLPLSQFHLAHQLSVALQCATGMEYLSSKGFVHGDLAARNVLIDSKLQIKIANLALAKDPHNCEYEVVTLEGSDGSVKTDLLPLRWMSPEVIISKGSKLSTLSDVWSYGVLVLEILTLGRLPLDKLNGNQITDLVNRDPNLLRKAHHWPNNCPLHIRKAVERCMATDAGSRSNFSDVVIYLANAENII